MHKIPSGTTEHKIQSTHKKKLQNTHAGTRLVIYVQTEMLELFKSGCLDIF